MRMDLEFHREGSWICEHCENVEAYQSGLSSNESNLVWLHNSCKFWSMLGDWIDVGSMAYGSVGFVFPGIRVDMIVEAATVRLLPG